jgi:Zn-finger nucleic acid-binding protein
MDVFVTEKVKELIEQKGGGRQIAGAFRSSSALDGSFGESWLVVAARRLWILDSKGISDPVVQDVSLGDVVKAGIEEKGTGKVGRVVLSSGDVIEMEVGFLDEAGFAQIADLIATQKNGENQGASQPFAATQAPSEPEQVASSAPRPSAAKQVASPRSASGEAEQPASPSSPPSGEHGGPQPPPPATARACCKCHVDLIEQFNGRATIDVCPHCAGVFLDYGELDQALQKEGVTQYLSGFTRVCGKCRTAVDEAEGACSACGTLLTPVICPACAHPMRPIALGKMVVEICSRCMGMWFDPGELAGVQDLYTPKEPAPPTLHCAGCNAVLTDPSQGYYSDAGLVCVNCFQRQDYSDWLDRKIAEDPQMGYMMASIVQPKPF